jgi:hypothetical protein
LFTIAWWYILATEAAVLAGLLVDPVWFYVAIGLCFVQAAHFGIEDKSFFSFSCQVRYGMILMFSAGLWEPARWIYWIPATGMAARLVFNYCLMARLMSLLPWNRREPFSAELLRKTVFSPPTRGPVLKR